MTTESLAGSITKKGQSGRDYFFGFGWACRYNLESIYGEGILKIKEDPDEARVVANVLMCGLQTKAANNLPKDFNRQQMYALLDDIGEEATIEVWQVAKRSLGFINRLNGLSDEDVERLTLLALQNQSAPQNQSQPTGEPS